MLGNQFVINGIGHTTIIVDRGRHQRPLPATFLMIRLDTLPYDVLLTLLKFLQPLDILGLRKTCKTLECATSDRTVWIDALRRVCARDTIFMPTFPVREMSLSALEYAATGPERFLRTTANSTLLKPRSHIIIDHDYDRSRKIFLVPGGRYLITADTTSVAIWDLGIPRYSSAVPQGLEPISSTPFDVDHLSIMLVHPIEDGRGLTVSISYEINPEVARAAIFRIYPCDESPSLRKIAELDLPPSVSLYSLIGNKLVFLTESTLNVWDYVEGAWAWVQVPNDFEQILISESGSDILLPYRDHISIWKMPPLSKSKPFFGLPPSDIAPAYILDIPNNQMVKQCRGPGDWYTGSPQRLLFDFGYGYRLERFEVVHTSKNFNGAVVVSLQKYLDSENRVYKSCRFCNNTLVSWWVVNNRARANIANVPSTIDSHVPDVTDTTIILHDDGSFSHSSARRYTRCDLCPFSGRFAYMDDFDCVTILDYCSESFPKIGSPEPPDSGADSEPSIVDSLDLWFGSQNQNLGSTSGT